MGLIVTVIVAAIVALVIYFVGVTLFPAASTIVALVALLAFVLILAQGWRGGRYTRPLP